MGRAEASVRLGEALTDKQCLQYIKDSQATDFPIEPIVREEMMSGHFRGKKVFKSLNKLDKNGQR